MTAPDETLTVDATTAHFEQLRVAVAARCAERQDLNPHQMAALADWNRELDTQLGSPSLQPVPICTASYNSLVSFHVAYVLDLAKHREAAMSRDLLKEDASRLHVLLRHLESPSDDHQTDLWAGIKRRAPEPDLGPTLEAIRNLALDHRLEVVQRVADGHFDDDELSAAASVIGGEFVRDVAALLLEQGAGARKAVLAIVDDRETADAVMGKRFAPRPLQFLAETVLRHASRTRADGER